MGCGALRLASPVGPAAVGPEGGSGVEVARVIHAVTSTQKLPGTQEEVRKPGPAQITGRPVPAGFSLLEDIFQP